MQQVIKDREIKTEWIQSVLAHPEKIEQDTDEIELKHALAKIPDYGNRVLRVIYKKKANQIKMKKISKL